MGMLPNPSYHLGSWVSDQPSLTKTEFSAEADINYIVKRFNETGLLPQMPPPAFGDISQVPRGTEALAAIRTMHLAWVSLPEAVRTLAGNDPAKLEAVLSDTSNYPYLVRIGFLKPVPPQPGGSGAAERAQPPTPTPSSPPSPSSPPTPPPSSSSTTS